MNLIVRSILVLAALLIWAPSSHAQTMGMRIIEFGEAPDWNAMIEQYRKEYRGRGWTLNETFNALLPRNDEIIATFVETGPGTESSLSDYAYTHLKAVERFLIERYVEDEFLDPNNPEDLVVLQNMIKEESIFKGNSSIITLRLSIQAEARHPEMKGKFLGVMRIAKTGLEDNLLPAQKSLAKRGERFVTPEEIMKVERSSQRFDWPPHWVRHINEGLIRAQDKNGLRLIGGENEVKNFTVDPRSPFSKNSIRTLLFYLAYTNGLATSGTHIPHGHVIRVGNKIIEGPLTIVPKRWILETMGSLRARMFGGSEFGFNKILWPTGLKVPDLRKVGDKQMVIQASDFETMREMGSRMRPNGLDDLRIARISPLILHKFPVSDEQFNYRGTLCNDVMGRFYPVLSGPAK